MRHIVLALAALLVGCHKREAQQQPPPAASKTVAPDKPDQDDVVLVAPGAEPRTLLHYKFTAGAKALLDITMDLAMKSPDLPAAALGTLPSPRFRLQMEITGVDADGTASLRSTIVGTGVTDQPGERVKAAQIQDKLALMSGLAFVAKVSPSGVVSDAQIAPGSTTPPEIGSQIEQLHTVLKQVVMALPTQPVGKDGQWQVTKHVEQQGLALTVTTTFKLVDLQADAFSFTSTTSELAKPSSAPVGGVHVVALEGHGEATGTVGLALPAMSGELKSTITTTVSAEPNKTEHLTLDLGVHIAVLPPGSETPVTAPGSGSAQGAQSPP